MLSSAIIIAAAGGLAGTAYAKDTSSDAQPDSSVIVVTGTREQSAQIKRDSKVVLDVRSEQEIRSLPDVNAAEALQRLPGVSLETDSGEGRFVNIRGMDADLNGTTYDGVRLTASNTASPQGGARAVAFDAFPSGILGGVEVVKSLSPDMDAEGLGGVVNIVPRSIPSSRTTFIQGSLGGGDETLRDDKRYMGDITLGGGFGGKTPSGKNRFEVILSYAYDWDKRGIDDVEADYINDPTVAPAGTSAYLTSKLYDDLQPRWYQYQRTRQGAAGSLVFRPDDDSSIYIRALHAGYVEYAHKHEFKINGLADDILTVDNATGDVTGDAVSPREEAISTKESLGNNLFEAGGNTLLGNVEVNARGAYTRGYDHFPYSIGATWQTPDPVTLTYNNTASVDVPTFRSADGTNLEDPAIYSKFRSSSNGPSRKFDREWSGVFNLAVPMGPGGSNSELKFGGSIRARKRVAHSFSASLLNPGGYASFVTGREDVFYNGAYDIGPAPDYSKLLTILEGPLTEDLTAYENNNENVYAGYAQYDGTFGPLSLVGGVRVEATDATYRANIDNFDVDGNETITPSSIKRKYTNIFPDLSLRYEAAKDVVLRAAYTTAIGRPGFNQITAAKTVDLQNLLISEGNPSLKPMIGHNFDLSAELYTPGGGLLSAGLFYKAFTNFIIGTVEKDVADPRFGAGNMGEIDSFADIGSAHADGIELNIHQPFYFLRGFWSGFGFDGNVTAVDSSGRVHQQDTTNRRLPQTSPFNFNASLFYEKGPVSARVAATYVSRNLWAVGGDPSTDLYSQPRFRLDLSAAYAINKHLELFAEGKNLTNTKLEFTQTSDRRYPVQREFYDMDVLGGVRFNFGH